MLKHPYEPTREAAVQALVQLVSGAGQDGVEAAVKMLSEGFGVPAHEKLKLEQGAEDAHGDSLPHGGDGPETSRAETEQKYSARVRCLSKLLIRKLEKESGVETGEEEDARRKKMAVERRLRREEAKQERNKQLWLMGMPPGDDEDY